MRKWIRTSALLVGFFFLVSCVVSCATLFKNPAQGIPVVFDEVAFHMDMAKEVLIVLEADGTLSKEEVAKYKPMYNEIVKTFQESGNLLVTFLETKETQKVSDVRATYRASLITAIRALSAWKSDKPNKEMLVVKIALAEGLKLLKQLPFDFDPATFTEQEKLYIVEQVKASLEIVKPWE